MNKQMSFPILRSVTAQMEERYIFNFLIKPDDLAKKLPVSWLEPQIINDWSVVSFCILWLKRLAISPIPPLIRFDTISCAYRIGVIDKSGSTPEPSVYITDRWADLALIARLAPWILHDTVPVITASIGHTDDTTHVQMSYLNARHLFSAETKPTDSFQSQMFESVDAFAKFIKDGVSSYAPSIYKDTYSKVDLHKEDVSYMPLSADIEYSELHHLWDDITMTLDSTVRATGAKYKWTYRGLWAG